MLFFLSFPFVTLLFFFMIVSYNTKNYRVNEDVKKLFLGDSHLEYGIIDTMLLNSKNLSKGAESFYYSYHKLKLVLTSSNVKSVYLGFSYHNLSSAYDQWTYGNGNFDFPSSYFYLLPFSEKLNLILWNRNHLSFFFKNTILKGFDSFINGPTFLSNFHIYSKDSKAESDRMDRKLTFFYEDRESSFSNLNIKYLNKIIRLLKSKKIELVFVNTPIHPYYFSKIPKPYFVKFDSIINTNNIKLIDFNKLNITNDDYYMPDGEHVNARGANLITNELMKKYNN